VIPTTMESLITMTTLLKNTYMMSLILVTITVICKLMVVNSMIA
jgi:hypothetical protein